MLPESVQLMSFIFLPLTHVVYLKRGLTTGIPELLSVFSLGGEIYWLTVDDSLNKIDEEKAYSLIKIRDLINN